MDAQVYITSTPRRDAAWQNARIAELLSESDRLRQRFAAKVRRTPDCWLWTGSATPCGYGQMWVGRRGDGGPLYAHRIAWQLSHGPVPEGLSVLHHCDTPACVRPDHLFLGTHTDNMRDASRKGRLRRTRLRRAS